MNSKASFIFVGDVFLIFCHFLMKKCVQIFYIMYMLQIFYVPVFQISFRSSINFASVLSYFIAGHRSGE